jgi:hypothetical protein
MVLDEIIIAISGIAAGVVTALVTVWREHKKDIVERYEERADMYKKAHFNSLIDIINTAKKSSQDTIMDIDDTGEELHYGISTLEVPGLYIETGKQVSITTIYKKYLEDSEVLSHLQTGYDNLYEWIGKADELAMSYEPNLSNVLKRVMVSIDKIKDKLPSVEPYNSDHPFEQKHHTSTGAYFPYEILNYIIANANSSMKVLMDDIYIENNMVKSHGRSLVDFDHYNEFVRSVREPGSSSIVVEADDGWPVIIADSRDKETKFFKDICIRIARKYMKDIKYLKESREEISGYYQKIIKEFSGIIYTWEGGLEIRGSCERCKTIEHGKTKKILLPYMRI